MSTIVILAWITANIAVAFHAIPAVGEWYRERERINSRLRTIRDGR